MLIDWLSRHIAAHPIVADEEVLIPSWIVKTTLSNIDLCPATANVGSVAPQHLSDDVAPSVGGAWLRGHREVVHDPRPEAPDVSVPQVINDLSEVDVLSEGPSHILSNARRMVELAGASLATLLMEDLWEATESVGRVVDLGTLIGPDLRHLSQLRVPGQGRQARHLGVNASNGAQAGGAGREREFYHYDQFPVMT